MLRRSATILFIALLALGGAACSDDDRGGSSGPGPGSGDGAAASGSTAAPRTDFCDLLLTGAPTTSDISENIEHYEALRSEAPDALEPDIDAVIAWYESQAADGQDSVTAVADAETQGHIAKIVDAAFECTN